MALVQYIEPVSGHSYNVAGCNGYMGLHQGVELQARDMGMAEEDAKVHLVLLVNQDILSCLDAYC